MTDTPVAGLIARAAQVFVSKYGARIRQDPRNGLIYVSVPHSYESVGDDFHAAVFALGLDRELFEWTNG